MSTHIIYHDLVSDHLPDLSTWWKISSVTAPKQGAVRERKFVALYEPRDRCNTVNIIPMQRKKCVRFYAVVESFCTHLPAHESSKPRTKISLILLMRGVLWKWLRISLETYLLQTSMHLICTLSVQNSVLLAILSDGTWHWKTCFQRAWRSCRWFHSTLLTVM